MAKGKIYQINKNRGMVAIQKDNNDFTIIELLNDWDIDINDNIYWSNEFGLGHEIYSNTTKNTRSSVYVQNHNVSKSSLNQQLLLPN